MASVQRVKGGSKPRSAYGAKETGDTFAWPLLKSVLAIAAISASSLAYESLLTRLFSLVFQYHFAFVAVSLAIFGLGAGAFLAYISGWTTDAQNAPKRLFRLGLAAALSLPLSAILFSRIIAVDLAAITILISLVPFLFVGMFSAVLYAFQSEQGAAIYAGDLGGAALGLTLALGLISLLGAFNAVFVSGGLAALAALAFARKPPERAIPVGLIVLLAALIGVNLGTRWIDLPPSLDSAPPDKVMFSVLADPANEAKSIDTLWSAFARVDLVQTNDPDQMDVFTDAGAGSFMLRFDGDLTKFDWLLMQPGYLPFVNGPVNKVLILGAGAGKDVVQALKAGSTDITAVEINPAMVALTRRYADYNGGILDYPGVHTIVTDGRNFIERSKDAYDLIYLNLVYAQATQPGSAALSEAYIFTEEAFQQYWDRLATDGRIAIVSHQALEGSRSLLTALSALQQKGMPTSESLKHAVLLMQPSNDPNQRLTVMMLKRTEWTTDEIDALLHNANVQGLMPLFIPGRYEDTMSGLVHDEVSIQDFLTDPEWNLAPTSDDRPFFFNLNPGLPSAVETILVISMGGLLVFLLLALLSRNRPQASQLGYFLLPGLGFMLLEMPLIQRAILLLGSPTLAAAAVLGGLLLGAGLGSLFSRRWKPGTLQGKVLLASLLICGLALVYAWVQPALVKLLLPAGLALRALGAVLMVLPFALPLGLPFSSGLRLLPANTPGKTALLWGWNATASVLGAALAVALAMLAGFRWSLVAGGACYLALAILIFGLRSRGKVW